jgi:asparagine synthetase B (glutamine-hydrolysing)
VISSGDSAATADVAVRVQLDGELYNSPRLREIVRGHGLQQAADGGDVDLVRGLYEVFGPDLVHAVDGKFALAIEDGPGARLLLATGRFGARPVFHSLAGEDLAFASRLSGLGLGADAKLDPTAVAEYFEQGRIAAPRTVCAGVGQLGPGQLLERRRGAAPEVRTYWRPPEPTGGGLESMAEVLEELERLLERSVAARLAAGGAGVLIDGGTGDALTAALAARLDGGVRAIAIADDAARLAQLAPGFYGSLDLPVDDFSVLRLHAAAQVAAAGLAAILVPVGAAELFAAAGRSEGRRGAARAREGWPSGGRGRVDAALLAAADRACSAAQVELRAPYLEQELVELAMSISEDDQLGGRRGSPLRRLLAELDTPAPAVASNPSHSTAGELLRGGLAPVLGQRLEGAAAVAEGWVDGEQTRRSLDDFERGREGLGQELWRTLVFCFWLDALRGRDGG